MRGFLVPAGGRCLAAASAGVQMRAAYHARFLAAVRGSAPGLRRGSAPGPRRLLKKAGENFVLRGAVGSEYVVPNATARVSNLTLIRLVRIRPVCRG